MNQELRIKKKNNKKHNSLFMIRDSNRGFTFIELIIYISIVTMMMTTIIPFAWNIIEGGAKSSTEQEVFSNARYISERIKYEIRNAAGINSVAATSISLIASPSANNPTVIDLSGGNIRIKQGSANAINLNSQNASISALNFTNFTSADNKTENIQFTITVNASYAATRRQEYLESTTIQGSAEVRGN